jgi:hypothetical protein
MLELGYIFARMYLVIRINFAKNSQQKHITLSIKNAFAVHKPVRDKYGIVQDYDLDIFYVFVSENSAKINDGKTACTE